MKQTLSGFVRFSWTIESRGSHEHVRHTYQEGGDTTGLSRVLSLCFCFLQLVNFGSASSFFVVPLV